MVRIRLGSHLVFSALYVTYIPHLLVVLTTSDGSKHVHIAPKAFTVASNKFKDNVEFWQEAAFQVIWKASSLRCVSLFHSLKLSLTWDISSFLVQKCFVSTERILLLRWTKMLRSQVAIKHWEPGRTPMILCYLHGLGMKFMCTPVSFRATALASPGGNTQWGTSLYWHIRDDVELTVTVQRENGSVTNTFKVFPPHKWHNYPSCDLLLFNF